ncbi:MAG TPA: RdgB/HAM1 family non-canonical purine NTP pyrophosphatase [Pyrinomonadaceae bacterium]|nr:RdgB/HAM1 family non-canonical purine NTP pyrophosphatase [Pyrinomonadaceae bacterium]
MSPTNLLIGTRNQGKVREIQEVLRPLNLTLHDLDGFPNVPAPFESGSSYEENATIKASYYAHETGLRTLGDDSGLEVAALDGAPGLRSARFGGDHASDSDRVTLLLSKIDDASMRDATFVCVMAIVEPNGRVLHVAEGRCKGTLAMAPAGDSGFGYDPIFIADGYDVTFGELASDIKNRISHRALALAGIREFFMSLRG